MCLNCSFVLTLLIVNQDKFKYKELKSRQRLKKERASALLEAKKRQEENDRRKYKGAKRRVNKTLRQLGYIQDAKV